MPVMNGMLVAQSGASRKTADLKLVRDNHGWKLTGPWYF